MGTGYTRSPLLLKGALIEISEPFLGPVPNVIVFQYNPESLSRALSPWQPPSAEAAGSSEGEATSDERAQPFDPEETITFSLQLDATDALEHPEAHPVATWAGVADRLAALEKLLYPTGEGSGLIGDALASLGGSSPSAERSRVPITLFTWGPGRILPVRVTSFSVTEQHFSPTLYPIRAQVSLGLKVLPKHAIRGEGTAEDIARAAWDFTQGQKDLLAVASLANTVESIVNLLPF